MKDLHILPKFSDRWSHVYLEHAKVDQDAGALVVHDKEGHTPIPLDRLAFLMLGPGTAISHAAMKALADNNTLVCWTGEQGVRLYAHNTGGTHSAFRLLHQARLFCDDEERRRVVLRMYQKRFPEPFGADTSIEQIRGMEGARVRASYQKIAKETGVEWRGRSYDQNTWEWGDPLNRALSSANACLYGISHAAILSAGYSPAIGFIHTGKMLSFVYDVADFYKTELAVPTAFRTVAEDFMDVERRTRIACRNLFYETKLMDRILPDIAEVLNAPDDLGESPGELEGRIVTLADRAQDGGLPGQPEREGPRRAVGDGREQVQRREGDPDME